MGWWGGWWGLLFQEGAGVMVKGEWGPQVWGFHGAGP